MTRDTNPATRSRAGVRSRRAVIGGAAVLTMAGALGVLATGQAQAANDVGRVTITAGGGWGAAWNACRASFPGVRSTHFVGAGPTATITSAPGVVVGVRRTEIWRCSLDA